MAEKTEREEAISALVEKWLWKHRGTRAEWPGGACPIVEVRVSPAARDGGTVDGVLSVDGGKRPDAANMTPFCLHFKLDWFYDFADEVAELAKALKELPT